MTPDTFYKVRPIAAIHNNIRVLLQNYDIVMITTPMSWVLELMLIELLTNKM